MKIVAIAILGTVCVAGILINKLVSESVDVVMDRPTDVRLVVNNGGAEPDTECATLPFHFLIVENALYSESIRHVEIFLDDAAFSEANLKDLFSFISKKYVEPIGLTIVVKTNWQQLSLPSDCPPSGMSNTTTPLEQYNYHEAIFYRRDRNNKSMYFRYNPELTAYKTVVLDSSAQTK